MDGFGGPTFTDMAKTAIHSAAAKAEKVLTDIRIDLKNDRERGDGKPQNLARREGGDQLTASTEFEEPAKKSEEVSMLHFNRRGFEGHPLQKTFLRWDMWTCQLNKADINYTKWKPLNLGKKQDWQHSLKNFRIGKRDVEEKTSQVPPDISIPANCLQWNQRDIPDMKEMGSSGLDHGRNPVITTSIPPAYVLKNLAAANMKAKTFKSVKDFPMQDSDSPPMKEKLGLSFSVVKSIVVREKDKLNHEMCGKLEISSAVQVLFDSVIVDHMYPWCSPGSFLVKVSEIAGSFKSLHKMVLFWHNVVTETMVCGKPIPHMPLDENPDLDCCRLHQQLQVINCCIARKLRRINATNIDFFNKLSEKPTIYAKVRTGAHVLRLGAETGEQIYSPLTQEGPVLTEELIKETEEFVLRTGSIGAGCSQLLSDMQAFKAANPGCILEDFIRWYSPPDWKETNDLCDSEDVSSSGGCLSGRMQGEGNLWRELWETAKPLPAAKQAPLFDEDLAVESTLTSMASIPPSELLEQLFLSMAIGVNITLHDLLFQLCSGFVVAESVLAKAGNIPKLFYECKDYISTTCQSGLPIDIIDDLCKVYETVEKILTHPEARWVSGETALEEPRSRLKKLHLSFMGKDKEILPRPATKDQKKLEDKNASMFSNLFDGKPSLFTKKQPPPSAALPWPHLTSVRVIGLVREAISPHWGFLGFFITRRQDCGL
ncbi:unnamed protein product [Spirodela intermedia]|uniref:Rab3GAP catalytic subunit conserved domain-containing protein n=1 Tax=Spirodela intermedia TaxID=51605 RepID=A0A7I8JRB9_SPIIN|nr:unnamed protein product [Spirodela intermedia]CAA6671982.1 unnamed protein product [Spirodela intermedia]